MNKRYEELDSIRGLAALSVVFAHYLNIFQSSAKTTLIEYGPLRLIVAGNEAVLLFFLLSGFVLSLPFLKGRDINLLNYRDFAIKRIARIYLPYLVAILLTIVCNYLFYKGSIHGLSDWFNARWSQPITLEAIIQHIIFLGEYPKQFNVVSWSLVEELRISLIFPIIMIIVLKSNWKGIFGLSVALYFLSILIRVVFGSEYDPIANTIHYSVIFVIGALIAKYKDAIINYTITLTKIKKILFVVIGLFMYTYAKPSFAINIIYNIDIFYRERVDFIFTILGASMIVIMSMSIKPISKFLLNKVIKFVGKISFSLYLYHLVILLTFVNLFSTILPIGLILILSFAFSILVSTISYYYVEQPTIKLGKKIVSRLSKEKKESIRKDVTI